MRKRTKTLNRKDMEYTDINGVPLHKGLKVFWDDEAGYDEDEGWVKFTIVEEDGNGYFNIKYRGERNPERWAWCGELEVINPAPKKR